LDKRNQPKKANYKGFVEDSDNFGKNVFSYVDIEAIGVAGTATGHTRHK
jgi:hypothetical protein